MSDLIVKKLYQGSDEYSVQDLNAIVNSYANNDQTLLNILNGLAKVFTDNPTQAGILSPAQVQALIDMMINLGIDFDDPDFTPFTESCHDQIVPMNDIRYAGEIQAMLQKEPWVSLLKGVEMDADGSLFRLQLFQFLHSLLYWVIDGTHYSAKPIRVTDSTGDNYLTTLTDAFGQYLVVTPQGAPVKDSQGNDVYEPLPVGGEYISLLTYRIKRIMARHLRTLYRVSAFEAGLTSNGTDLAGDYLQKQIAWDVNPPVVDRRHPPVVSAGSDRNLLAPETVTMGGSFGIDGLDGPATAQWQVVSQPFPGAVTFVDPSDPETEATFSAVGEYTLRLMVSTDNLSSFDDSTILVQQVPVGELPVDFVADGTGGTQFVDGVSIGGGQYQLDAINVPFGYYSDDYAHIRHTSRLSQGEVIAQVIQPPGIASLGEPNAFAGIMIRNFDRPSESLIGVAIDDTGEGVILFRDLHHRMVQRSTFTPSGSWFRITLTPGSSGRFSTATVWSSSNGTSWSSEGSFQHRNPRTDFISVGLFSHAPGMLTTSIFNNFRSSWYDSDRQVTPKISAGQSFVAILDQPTQLFGIKAHNPFFGPPELFWQAVPEQGVTIDDPNALQPTVTFTNTGNYQLIMQSWVPGGIVNANTTVQVEVVSVAQSNLYDIPKRFPCGWASRGPFRFLRRDADFYVRNIDTNLLIPENDGDIENTLVQEESFVSLPMGLLRIPRSLIRFKGDDIYRNQVTLVTLHADLKVMNDPSDTGWQEPWEAGDTSIIPIEKNMGMGVASMPAGGMLSGTQKDTLDVVGSWRYQHGSVVGVIIDGQARYISIRITARRWALNAEDLYLYLREMSQDSNSDELRRINNNSTDFDDGVWHSVGFSHRQLCRFVAFQHPDFRWDDEQLVSATVLPIDLDTQDGERTYSCDIPMFAHLTKNDRRFSFANLNGCINTFEDAWSIRSVSSVQAQQNTLLFSDGQGSIENFPTSFEGSRAIIFLADGSQRITQISQKIGDSLALFPEGDVAGVQAGDVVIIDRQVPEETLDETYRNEATANSIIDLRPIALAPVDNRVRQLPALTSPIHSPGQSPYELNPGPGDFEVNKVVARTDVDDFLENWRKNELETGFLEAMDLDGSGIIDYADLELLTQLYGNTYSPQGPSSPAGSPGTWGYLPQWFLDKSYNAQVLREHLQELYKTMSDATETIARYNIDQRFFQKASNYRKVVDLRDSQTNLTAFVLEWINNWEENQEKPWIRDEGILIHWPDKNLEETGRRETVVPLTRYDTSNVAGEDDRLIIDEREGWGDVPQLVRHWNSQDHIRYPTRVDSSLTFVSEKNFVIPAHTKLAGTFFFQPEDTHIVDPVVRVTLTQDQIIGGETQEVFLGSFEFELGRSSSFRNVEGVFLLDGEANYNPVTNRLRINYSSILDFSTDQPGRVTFAYSYHDLALIHPLFRFSPRDMGLEISHLADAQMFTIEGGAVNRLTIPDPDQPDDPNARITPLLRLEGISVFGNDTLVRWNRDDIQYALAESGIIRSWWVIRALPWVQINSVTYDDFGKAIDVDYDVFWVDENPTVTFSIDDEDRNQQWYEPCMIKYGWVDATQSNIHTEDRPSTLNPRFVFYQKQNFLNFDGELLLASTQRSIQFALNLPPQDYRWTQIWDQSTTGKESLNSMAVFTDKRTRESHMVFGVYRDGVNGGSTAILSDEITLGTVTVQDQLFIRRPVWMDDPQHFQVDFVGMVTVINDTSIAGLRTNNKLQAYGYWYAGHSEEDLEDSIAVFSADGIRLQFDGFPRSILFWRQGDIPNAYLYRWNNLLQIGRDQNRPGAP